MKITRMKVIKYFLLFVQRFGIWHGIRLSIRFSSGRVKHIKLPKVKYPFSLRAKTSDIPTFAQVFLEDHYEVTIPAPPKTVIDGGANVGLFTIKMKSEYPDAKIICIEPDKENFQVLQANLSLYKDIYMENSGLWNKDTTLRIHDKYDLGKWGMVVEEDVHEGNISAISMNSLCKKYAVDRIDILKLDIETSEKKLFQDNYNEWLSKVKILIIELHDLKEDGCSKPFFEAINKTFLNYKYLVSGEHTIIINQDMP